MKNEKKDTTKPKITPETVWLDALSKRMVDLAAGRCGLYGLISCSPLNNADEMVPLVLRMKAASLFYERTLSMLKHNVVDDSLLEHVMTAVHVKEIVGSDAYRLSCCRLVSEKLVVTPEAVLSDVSYDRLADGYCAGYEAFGLVLVKAASVDNVKKFHVPPEISNYLGMYFLRKLSGEQKMPPEEKIIQQFILRGNLAGIELDEAKKLITLACQVWKYGYLYEILSIPNADIQHSLWAKRFQVAYAVVNRKIQEKLGN